MASKGCPNGRVLVLGDSIVARLNRMPGFVLEVEGTRIELEGFPGFTLEKLCNRMEKVMETLYREGYPYGVDVAVLALGGNDLCNIHISVDRFVEQFVDLSQMLLIQFGVSKVIICQILHRTKHHSFYMRGLTLDQYNARVDNANAVLAVKFPSNGPVVFWRHHHSVLGPSRLDSDGVHLNSRGLNGFRRSLYYALRTHSK
jgi:lysophospholipase L1-like esterase